MRSQPWRSQRVEQGKQQLSNGSRRSEGSSASIYATPTKPAQIESRLKPSPELPLNLLSSPSRGLDQSDANRDITNADTQSQYRLHISERIKKHSEKYGTLGKGKQRELFPINLPDFSGQSNQKAVGVDADVLESLRDILLLIRRLREGCVAAARRDAFAVDVYALSTFISIIIAEDIQLSSSLPRLFDLLASQPTTEDQHYAVQQDLKLLLGDPCLSSDMDISKESTAALYLLWLSVTGGQVARIGGSRTYRSMTSGHWLQHRESIMATLSKQEQDGTLLRAAEAIQNAISRCDVIAFRSTLLDIDLTNWQQAMIRRSIDRLRDHAWNTLIKSYMHVPIDGRLIGEGEVGDDWLERMLLIDVELMPIPTSHSQQMKHRPPLDPTPDAWDDSMDKLSSTLQSTSIREDEILDLRAGRLATFFERYNLSPDATSGGIRGRPLDRWNSRKVIQGGIPHLRLR